MRVDGLENFLCCVECFFGCGLIFLVGVFWYFLLVYF